MVYVNVDIMAVCLLSVVCLSRHIQGMSTKTLYNYAHAIGIPLRIIIRHEAIIWTNTGLLSIRPLEANFSEILIKMNFF